MLSRKRCAIARPMSSKVPILARTEFPSVALSFLRRRALATIAFGTSLAAATPSLIFAFVLSYSGPSTAQSPMACTDVPDIMVPEGFDCEIFAEGLNDPTALAVEPDGNVLVTETGFRTGPEPIIRFSPDGDFLGESNLFVDPDGVAVDSAGRILVTDSPQITIVNSLDGAMDEICQPVPGNLQDVAVDSQGRIVVINFAGDIFDVVCGVSATLCTSLGLVGVGVAFDENDRLFATRFGAAGGLFLIDQCQPSVPTQVTTLSGARHIAFGPGGQFGEEIYVSDENVPNAGRIVTVDEATGGVTEFATGFMIPSGLGFQGTETLYVDDLLNGRIIAIGSVANEPPLADSGQEQTAECTSPAGASVTLDGSGSSDPDGDSLTYVWSNSFGIAIGVNPVVDLTLGIHLINLVVNDGELDSDPDTVTVDVVDMTPPGLVASLTLVGEGDDGDDDDEGRFRINFAASDACDSAPTVTAVLVVPGAADISVVDGQIIEFEFEDDETEVESEDGILEIEAPSLTLRATATDASGNAAIAEVQPAGLGGDNDDDTVAFANDDD